MHASRPRDGGTWMFVLVILLTLMPSACVLWFMNQALATEWGNGSSSRPEASRNRNVETPAGIPR